MTSNGALIILMGLLFLLLGYMGVPVAFALIASVLLVTMFTPVSEASMIAQIFNGMDVEALLAVPFFLLVGDLMTSANVTVRMIRLSQTMVGHLRGGLAQVVTLFSMFFAGISGSSAADVAVLSRTLAPEMDREGYDRAFTAALIASAATMANLIPPSIMAVVYGATGNVSIGGLFLGGVVPGVLVGMGLMIYSHFFGPMGLKRRARNVRRVLHGGQRSRRAADDPDHHHGRHPHRAIHSDRGWRYRGGLYRFCGDSAAQLPAPAQPAARHGAHGAALFHSAHHDRRGLRIWLDAGLSARTGDGLGLDFDRRGRRPLYDHAAADAAVHHCRRFHRRSSGHHHFHAADHRPHQERRHQPGSYGSRDHNDARVRADHAALRTLPAHGVEIRRYKVFQGHACVAADLHRFLRSHRIHHLLPGRRPVAAEASVAAVSRLLPEPERHRLHLPLGLHHALH